MGPNGRRYKEFLVLWTGYLVDDASRILATNFYDPQGLKELIDSDRLVEDN